jgi:hypothetical protein
MAQLRATTLVDCPFSAAVERLGEALGKHAQFDVSPFPPLAETVHVGWAVIDDVRDEARIHDAISLHWTPQHGKYLPRFHGTITVRPYFRRSSMRLAGDYEPPFGPAGRIFDRIIGRVLAWLTIRRVLRVLKGWTEERYQEYRKEIAYQDDRHVEG